MSLLQKIRGFFEWIAQKRAAKDREVLDSYQWTTYRSNKEESSAASAQENKAEHDRSQTVSEKKSSANDFTASPAKESSGIEPKVDIDVASLFNEEKLENQPSEEVAEKKTTVKKSAAKKPAAQKPAAKKTTTRKTATATKEKSAVAKKSRVSKAETTEDVGKVDEKQTSEISNASEEIQKPAPKKRRAPAKSRTVKKEVKDDQAKAEEKPEEKPAAKTKAVAKAKPEEKNTEIKEEAASSAKKTTRRRTAAKKAEPETVVGAADQEKKAKPTKSAATGEYREIVRGRTLQSLQALLKDEYPQVMEFTRKFDISTFLRQTPEAVEAIKVKLSKSLRDDRMQSLSKPAAPRPRHKTAKSKEKASSAVKEDSKTAEEKTVEPQPIEPKVE